MAKIRPYESQVSAQAEMPVRQASPSDVGGTGLVNLGQATESLGQNVGVVGRIVQQNATRAAITDVHTMLAGTKAEYTKQAMEFEAKADPKDTNLWEQFYHGGNVDEPTEGSLKWMLDSYREKIDNGQALQTFDRGASDLLAQFGVHFAQVQSKMAGVHAKNQAVKMIDAAQTTVQSDPSQYTPVLDATMQAIDDPNSDYGRAGVEQKQAIKTMATQQIASSTVRGMIRDSPQHALHSLQTGEWDSQLKGADKITLIGAAETGIRAQEVEARRVEAERLRQQKALYDATDQQIGTKYALNHDNPGKKDFPPVTATEIGRLMNADQLDGPTGRAWLNMIDESARRGQRAQHTNPVIEHQLFKRIHLPDGDPKKIIDTVPVYEAYAKGHLSDGSMKFLREEIVQSRSPEGSIFGREKADFLKGIEPQITKPGPFGIYQDPSTPEKFANFTRELNATIEKYRKAGKDPRVLFDESSPEYFGKIAKSSKYQSTGFGSTIPQPVPSTAPRKSLDEIFGVKP